MNSDLVFEVLRFVANIFRLGVRTLEDLGRKYLKLVVRSFIAMIVGVGLGGSLVYIGYLAKLGFLTALGFLAGTLSIAQWMVVSMLLAIIADKITEWSPITARRVAALINVLFVGIFFSGYIWVSHAYEYPVLLGIIVFTVLGLAVSEMLVVKTTVTAPFTKRLRYVVCGVSVLVIILGFFPKPVLNRIFNSHVIERASSTVSTRINYHMNEKDQMIVAPAQTVLMPFSEYGKPQLACVAEDGKYPACFKYFEGAETYNQETGKTVPPITVETWPLFKEEMKKARDVAIAKARQEAEEVVKQQAKAVPPAPSDGQPEQPKLSERPKPVPVERPKPVSPPPTPPPPVYVPPSPPPPTSAPQVIFLKTVVTGQVPDPNNKNGSLIVATVQDSVDLPYLSLKGGEDLMRYQVVGLTETDKDSYLVQLNPFQYVSGNTTQVLPAERLDWLMPSIPVKKGSGRSRWLDALKVAAGAGAGAAIGGALGGKEGAAEGAAFGGGAVAVALIVAKHNGKEFNVPAGTEILLRLTVK